ncbi:M48 family metallopeptidase [Methylobacterium gnaphalii]|uniref:Metalloendopeptidase n=1 Tax=Methylobacterium gnaphalii TaxID=1010610 RepID=A0A512JEG1_9HYPH|nr:M48 family metallopeptidase [Methylobacterium gnaphalii]GEP08334.1 metalloendopeptidase [Methylobacterium gnaphalii]GJD67890.1 Beta-barrel assembly-enhancing protease [Methylobacterium gnaphalii]GLS51035.1 metalloendopeptidase [Methylobacterium gnaphalii]
MSPPPATIVATGTFFDGLSARPHPVTLRLGSRLEITGSGIREDWRLYDIRASETEPPTMRLALAGSPTRVEFTDEALSLGIEARCPDLRIDDEGRGGMLRLVLWSIAAGISVLLVAIYGVPAAAAIIAPLVPQEVETRFGAAVDGQVVSLLGDPPLCDGAAGKAVLDRLVTRMTEGAVLPGPLVVSVRRHTMANALTLPGARVIVLSDLIEKANTPDEFAGVLAHEIGHVAHRDPTQSVITAGGVSFLLSLILGDLTGSTVIVGVGQAAIAAGYSRNAERAADAYGVAMMLRAGGDGAALATILERIDKDAEKEGSPTGFLRSHPYTKERAATIRRLAGARRPDTGILSNEDWQALKGICSARTSKPGDAKPETPGK